MGFWAELLILKLNQRKPHLHFFLPSIIFLAGDKLQTRVEGVFNREMQKRLK